MQMVRTFVVVPSLPESLQDLKKIANNLWWCWEREAVELFLRLDRDLWEACHHNPVKLIGMIPQERLDALSKNAGYLSHLDRVRKKMETYMNAPRWYDSIDASEQPGKIAYFSAEFGIHECLPIYSGGLGILAGDHLKSASDLGLPLVGMGLLYRQGFFQQYLNNDGWQQEVYPENDFYNMPLTLMLGEDGRAIRFHVDIAGHDVVVQIWKVQVGRINLYLLDANLRCNRIEDRQITANLYGGDNEVRIRQEILLGIGGLTALKILDENPQVCHMNEGHAAFMSLERIRRVMEEHHVNFSQAREATVGGNVFTTHTPVPAGHDVFSPAMMEKYFSHYSRHFGLSWNDFLCLGRNQPDNRDEPFSMTVLALRLSSHRNGVSKLHGQVSREMCRSVWPWLPTAEVPVDSITNGIHVRSWISHEMSELYERYLGSGWNENPGNRAIFERIEHVPAEEIWRTHERRRERLVVFARHHLRSQLQRRGASLTEIAAADEVLNPEALTIGFARRFATYKRGTLLFHDLERIKKILTSTDCPVQILFAGKSHPRDTAGKELIRKIVHLVREEPFRRRVVFLENYDINVARYLVQGVDLWLNTPRRGMEASGTSGMKVLANGGLNMSILDGWWCEGYHADVGWAIGQGESYEDTDYENEVESNAIYNLLEKEVIPAFYNRGSDNLPHTWIKMMKQSMCQLTPVFSTARMVSEYAQKSYLPSAQCWELFMANDLTRAKALSDWKESIRDRWHDVSIEKIEVLSRGELLVGGNLKVRAQVHLGSVTPKEVAVEIYQGPIDSDEQILEGSCVAMEFESDVNGGQAHLFTGLIPCKHSGQCGFSVRVIPHNDDVVNKFDTGLICWEGSVSEDNQPVAVEKHHDAP